MQAERWRTCTEIFHAALERPPDEREAFIEQSCGTDAALRRQVETLLKYHDQAGDFIASPAAAAAPELLTEDPDALIGRTLGNYRIDGVLGAGGMGVVYLAHDERLGRKVGLKLLPRAFVNDAAQLERLKREARTASALNHPNIVTVHEIGQVDSTYFMAIEFIEGVTLRERIANGPLPPDEVVEITSQVANALCVAHRAGIVHRDIKPENIMIRPDGYVKVLDFGIAKTIQAEITSAASTALWQTQTQTHTRAGLVLGTMRYMSPEQTRGEAVDARSDIWSVGVVVYEMLTARAPFGGQTLTDVKSAVLVEDPAPIDERAIPGALQDIVEKCLRKDPSDRFQGSDELLAALRAISGRARRINGRYAIAAIAAAAMLAAAGFYFGLVRRPAIMPPGVASGTPHLRSSTGVAVDDGGTIYLADFSHHTIRRITPDGIASDFAGTPGSKGSADGIGPAARFHNPGDTALDRNGTMYVADTNNHVIRKITPDATVTTIAGQAGEGGSTDGQGKSARFSYPTAVAVDDAGNVYVADFANHIVRKITPDGVVRTLAGAAGEAGNADGPANAARFSQPHGVAVDRAGQVYVADFGSHTIRKITPDGSVSTIAGVADNPGSADGSGPAARFNAPYDVAVDDAGNVYVADSSNHLVRKITPAGVVSTIAGAAANVGNADGAGGVARFAVPAAVAVNSAGDIYVADFGNHAVRRITPAGDVSTVAVRWAGTPAEQETAAIPAKSIAVLPFSDLSPQRDQQYFSDGMAEEILSALTHINDLKVAGRSSSFSFRGRNEDVRKIGAALRVAHILEGSVRRQGERVRISAQLIQVSDGFQLWSETFNGNVADVFALQERIARAITEQLKVVLQGEQKSQLVKVATGSSEAYALYLQATAIFNRRDSVRYGDAFAQLQQAIRLDPNFARAYARLSSLTSIAPAYDVKLPEDATAAVRYAHRAIELDPALAEPHAALGQILFTQRRFNEAHSAYQRAIELDGDDTAANLWMSTLLSSAGHPKASAALLDKLLANDPMLPNALLWRGWTHLQLGAIDEAERWIKRASDAGLTAVGLAFAHVAEARDDREALRDWATRGLEPFVRDLPDGALHAVAAAMAGDAQARSEAIALIESYVAGNPPIVSGAVPLALIWLGEPQRALAVAQEKPTRNDTVFLPALFAPVGRATRATPEFATFARRSGLAEFWDNNGPPENCAKNERGDYVCR